MHVNHPKYDHLTNHYNWGNEVADAKYISIFRFYDVAKSVFTDLWLLKDKKPFCLLIEVSRFPVYETTMYSERLGNLWKWNLWKGEQIQHQIINLQDKRKTMDMPERQFGGQNICQIA